MTALGIFEVLLNPSLPKPTNVHRRDRFPRYRRWLLLVGSVLGCSGPALAIEAIEVDALAAEIAYRLDWELGAAEAAQRHLLAWRLLSALERGEVAAGSSVADNWTIWQGRLEYLEERTDLNRLPAWFQPMQPGTVDALLASTVPPETDSGLDMQWLAATAVRMLTDREMSLLAHAIYPAQMAWARSASPTIWSRLLEHLANNPEFVPLVEPLIGDWLALPLDARLTAWHALKDVAAVELKAAKQKPQTPLESLQSEIDFLLYTVQPGSDRDPVRLRMLPYYQEFRSAIPDGLDRATLSLARAVNGLDEGRYVELIQVLLATAQLAIENPNLLQTPQRLRAILAELERLDVNILSQLGYVDARLLTIYQQARKLLRDLSEGQTDPPMAVVARLYAATLGDATDLAGYLAQPFREVFRSDQRECFDASRRAGVYPPAPIDVAQFEACLDDFSVWGLQGARSLEMAGDANGPFELEHVTRESELSPWQRINYWLGYATKQVGSGCPRLAEPLVNPLEWAVVAHSVLWFAERWPAYFANRDRRAWIAELAAAGEAVLSAQAQALSCRDQNGQGPLQLALDDYAKNLGNVLSEIVAAEAAYRAERLAPGADVRLMADARQPTSYRPEPLMVLPCDARPSCDMAGSLPVSRALLGLFPPPFLIADQIRLGNISVCYRQVQWVARRAVVPRVGSNPAVARYFGRLQFQLFGYYSGMESPVFGMQLTGRREYEYLFGANTESVLNDSCPRELINTQVSAQLPRQTIELVPRRLTYLTADRMSPTRVFEQNWTTGEEWQDWFVTGNGVEELVRHMPDTIIASLNARLEFLYADWNRQIYGDLMREGLDRSDASSLATAMDTLDSGKSIILALAHILLPLRYNHDAALRASLVGEDGLFSRSNARQMQRNGIPIDQTGVLADKHFRRDRALWSVNAVEAFAAHATVPMVATALLKLEALRLRYWP